MNATLRLSLVLAALLVPLAGLSLLAGKVWVPLGLWGGDDPRWWIILDLRLPRALLALLVGGGLGLCGAALQGYLRNPLADPSVLGISSSAALGAVFSIFVGLSGAAWALPGFALAGAATATVLLSLVVGRGGSPTLLVLTGVMLSSLTAALTTLLISLAPNPFATSEIVTWLIGALTDRSIEDVWLALPLILLGGVALLGIGPALDALSLGEAAAQSLGVNLARLRWRLVIGVGLTVGGAVAVSGVIGFVGLIVPHLLRPLAREQPSALLLPSALGGAALLLVADTLVRLAPGASELRVGVAMALVGAPFFLWLLLKLRRELA
ncbi:MAG: iron ABC transporter permease [Sphingomonadales bacterium]|nr:MAG: iron ABC transporter permease [Sphingomonadales bacterium]